MSQVTCALENVHGRSAPGESDLAPIRNDKFSLRAGPTVWVQLSDLSLWRASEFKNNASDAKLDTARRLVSWFRTHACVFLAALPLASPA